MLRLFCHFQKIVNVICQCTRMISYSGWKENGWYETVLYLVQYLNSYLCYFLSQI